ncbi:dTDP-4-dehydrorhamnose reductase [Candidatus Methylopumilus universalis]|uniref:dTDP-4-dehydrorhamnose reductase n=1 Tax=Candidatus Methylopumilus universalis TaxID=2588536 RepID=UPI00111CAAFD|nr:dTDP-4-dehydrorhamnose reductase [Candidatus Methylopumilus universalis]QDC47533.1 dTDP-4-dehydrorhamnose reductase [Candidatus Methylopumilus universalis]QDC72066.1 dTDP-4-dehydrorhamnose reductase [Candidatus Methylopumilus universalis]
MKILLTGKDGQVGFALHKKLLSFGEVIATGRHELDLANPDAIKAFIDKNKPDIIINPAAYTQVDKAESEKLLTHQINAIAPQVLADKASELHIPIIHFSTDYVFDGLKKEPYLETDEVNPQSVYGKTKWEGEEAVRQHKKHIIFRTSWVFDSHGQNFLKTIFKLIQEKTSLNVVSDQIGTPTSSEALADVTYHIIKTIFNDPNFKDFGTYHMTLEDETNWYRYACFITDEAKRLGLQTLMTSKDIKPISSDAYPTLAKRPMNSRLDTTKIKKTFMLELPHWEEEVKRILKALIH